ncbi:MAG: 2-oxo-4-hydroxy-4-carboxy-5-ureidoimidazoline decarboxylase [Proteobacteria bacterium]|nr:2-oxo-4-hydroxy-4-carboxy-5-ureidoimidazoline decarboxylase [Pseudomonadota bacterium]
MTPRPGDRDKEEFVARFGGVFEHSPWIAEETYDRGGVADNAAGLHGAMCQAMRAAGRARQLALIRAHPDLAGKLAIEGSLTEASKSEQASAGLDSCTKEEFERLSRLNAAYLERFGFPFILAVKGSTKEIILAAMEARLNNDAEAEFETALAQIERIARFRLEVIFGETSE